jgi:integrase
MKTELPNLLGAVIRDYFTDHLPRLRGTSPHTIHSYRDSIVLLLRFLSRQRNKPVTGLDLTDLDPPGILAFLTHLEEERKNGVSTRNVRLSAIHALFHFVASRNPEHLELAQRVLGIPFKRARQRAIDYLEYEEIDAVLKTINRTTVQGNRDYALLATMFNTGGRVQEIADLRVCDPTDQALSGEIVWKREKGALLHALATNGCGVDSILSARASGPAVGVSPLSKPPRSAVDTFWNPSYSRQMSRGGLCQCSKPPQKAVASSQRSAQYRRGPSEIGR